MTVKSRRTKRLAAAKKRSYKADAARRSKEPWEKKRGRARDSKGRFK